MQKILFSKVNKNDIVVTTTYCQKSIWFITTFFPLLFIYYLRIISDFISLIMIVTYYIFLSNMNCFIIFLFCLLRVKMLWCLSHIIRYFFRIFLCRNWGTYFFIGKYYGVNYAKDKNKRIHPKYNLFI